MKIRITIHPSFEDRVEKALRFAGEGGLAFMSHAFARAAFGQDVVDELIRRGCMQEVDEDALP